MSNLMYSDSRFLRSAKVQSRVIYALLMREVLTRFGRHNIGFMWMFAEPMIFTLGVAALWSFWRAGHAGMAVIPFAITGYSSVLLWRNMPGRCLHAIGPNLALMYHRNVKVIDIYASRLLLEFLGVTMSFVILCTVFIGLGLMPFPEDILKIIIGWFMLAWFGSSLAITIGALSEMSEIVEKIWPPTTYLLFPLSGAAFLVDWLPSEARKVILYLPMVHGVEILREGYFGSSIHAHYDIAYMSVISLCLTLLGLLLTQEVGRRVAPE